MLRFTARVPYHGLVEWTADDVDRYALGLRVTHQPGRAWIPGRAPTCRQCADTWPCTAYSWAEQWSTSITRTEASRHR